jgi:hypothetical protein
MENAEQNMHHAKCVLQVVITLLADVTAAQ